MPLIFGSNEKQEIENKNSQRQQQQLDNGICMTSQQWPSLLEANPPKMTVASSKIIGPSKTVKDRLLLTTINKSLDENSALFVSDSNSEDTATSIAEGGGRGDKRRRAATTCSSSDEEILRNADEISRNWCPEKIPDAVDVRANERIQKLERELAEVKCENNQLRDVCCEFGYKASLAESLSQAAPNGSNQWTQFNPQNACPPFTLHEQNGITATPTETSVFPFPEEGSTGSSGASGAMESFYTANPISASLLSSLPLPVGSVKFDGPKNNSLGTITSASVGIQPLKILPVLTGAHRLSTLYLELYQRTEIAELFWRVPCNDLRHNCWRFKQLLNELFVLIDMTTMALNGKRQHANSLFSGALGVVNQLEDAYQLCLAYLDLHYRTHTCQQRWLTIKGSAPDISASDNLHRFQLALNGALNQIGYQIRREKLNWNLFR